MTMSPANTSKQRVISLLPYRHVTVSIALDLEETIKLFKDSVSQRYVPPFQFLPPLPPPNTGNLEGDIAQGGFSLRTASTSNGIRAPGMAYISGQFIITKEGVAIDMHAFPGSTTLIAFILGLLVTLGSGIILSLLHESNYSLFVGGFAVTVISIIGYIIEVDALDRYLFKILQNYLIKAKD